MAKVTISEWVRKSEARLTAVMQQSAQDVINDAQKLRTRGGNMPLRDGFLTNSGVAQIGSMPSGPSQPPKGYSRSSRDAGPSLLIISRFKPGQVLYYGFTAEYARAMEQRYGFTRLAAQKWQSIVKRNTAKLRRMSGGN